MADEYFVDERPSVRGGPSATGAPRGNAEKPGSILTQKAGPLPVYGWAIVVVGAVFIYRRMTGSGSDTATGSETGIVQPSPSQMMGGVFLLPATGGGVGGAAQGDTVSAGKAVAELAHAYNNSLAPHDTESTPAQMQEFYKGISKTPKSDRAGLAQFFAENGAKKNLGLPYLTGSFNPAGYAQQYDPRSGTSIYIDPNTGKTASK